MLYDSSSWARHGSSPQGSHPVCLQICLPLCLGKQYLSVALNCVCTHSDRDLGLQEELWEEEEMWFFRWFFRPHASLCDTERCRVSCSCWGEADKAPLGSAASGGKGSCRCWYSIITCNRHSPAFVQHLGPSPAFLRHKGRKQVWWRGLLHAVRTCISCTLHWVVALPYLDVFCCEWIFYKSNESLAVLLLFNSQAMLESLGLVSVSMSCSLYNSLV